MLTDNAQAVLDMFNVAQVTGAPPPSNRHIAQTLGLTMGQVAGIRRRLQERGLIAVLENPVKREESPKKARRRSCQWIDGPVPRFKKVGVKGIDRAKCGAPTVRGKWWCQDHLERVYG